ncbi:hypothetical protein PF003_g27114 [Phytophthora fragariae]|nr:hypothetical protein PF003_g27114 [Phytophthora fragariae]
MSFTELPPAYTTTDPRGRGITLFFCTPRKTHKMIHTHITCRVCSKLHLAVIELHNAPLAQESSTGEFDTLVTAIYSCPASTIAEIAPATRRILLILSECPASGRRIA